MTTRSPQRHTARGISLALLFTIVPFAVTAQGQAVPVVGGGEPQQLSDALVFQIELTHRGNGYEKRAREQALATAVNAWNRSGRSQADREALTMWLREAIRASMPGVSRPMPAVPRFDQAVVAASPIATSPAPTTEALPMPAAAQPAPVVSQPTAQFTPQAEPPAPVAPPETTVAEADLWDTTPAAEEPPQIEPDNAPISDENAPAIDRTIAINLWEDSPASAPIDFTPVAVDDEAPATAKSAPAEEWPSNPFVPDPPAVTVVDEQAQPQQDDIAKLDLIAIDASTGDSKTVADLELIDLDADSAEVSQPTSPLLASATPTARVTVQRPIGEPSVPAPAVGVDVVRLTEQVRSYNRDLQWVERTLSADSVTAFQLETCANDLERLGERKQFLAIYFNGLNETQRERLPTFESAESVVTLLRNQLENREAAIGELPEQAVRTEASALKRVERRLRSILEE